MDTHVYEREVAGETGDSLSHVTRLIAAPGAVLDVGTGSGALGRYLLAHGRPEVDGITYNQAELERAQAHYRDIWLLDLTQPGALAALGERRYRYIVCADVLEHVTTPEAVLTALTTLLTEDGEVIISIPNVGYVGVIAELLGGDFLYRNEGLLDSTHLRFFTRRSLLRLVQSAGLTVSDWHSVVRPLPWSEFGREYVENLPPAVQRYLCAREDTHAYQFVAVAGREARAVAPPESIVHTDAPHFLAQVYWTDADGAGAAPVFDETNSARAFGLVGVEQQTLRFELPQLPAALAALRIDPADRPGVLRLHQIRLLDASGTVLWAWRPALGVTPTMQGMMALPSGPDNTEVVFAVYGDDPALILRPQVPVTACTWGSSILEVSMAWPQVPEASVLGQQLASSRRQEVMAGQRIAEFERDCTQLHAAVADLTAQLQLKYHQIDLHEERLAQQAHRIAEQDNHIAQQADHVARRIQDAALLADQKDQQIAQCNQAIDEARLQLAHAEGVLAGVRNSKLWRLGRWLRLTRISL